jgi:hypothetical protein
MRKIPVPCLNAQFDALLVKNKIPQKLHNHYLKWLRYYLDFCQRYLFSESNSRSLPNFIQSFYACFIDAKFLSENSNPSTNACLPQVKLEFFVGFLKSGTNKYQYCELILTLTISISSSFPIQHSMLDVRCSFTFLQHF